MCEQQKLQKLWNKYHCFENNATYIYIIIILIFILWQGNRGHCMQDVLAQHGRVRGNHSRRWQPSRWKRSRDDHMELRWFRFMLLLSYFYPQFNKGTDDPYSYLLFINDYSQLGFSESEARISFYGGETVVKMEVEDGNNEDRWIWFQFTFKLLIRIQCSAYNKRWEKSFKVPLPQILDAGKLWAVWRHFLLHRGWLAPSREPRCYIY